MGDRAHVLGGGPLWRCVGTWAAARAKARSTTRRHVLGVSICALRESGMVAFEDSRRISFLRKRGELGAFSEASAKAAASHASLSSTCCACSACCAC